jgi:catechol 2,3-dioxygenase-like lactoylglutathione lyase family enzyme
MTKAAPPTETTPGLHHLALRSADVDRTVAFYRDLFGFSPARDERPRSQWLRLGGGAVLMVETRKPDEPAHATGALELIAFGVSAEKKEEIRRVALDRGCYDGETPHTVYLRDPDGRRVGASTYPLD